MLFCLTVTLNRWLRFCFVHTFFFLLANIATMSTPAERINVERSEKKGQILMLYGIFHVLDHRIHCFFPFKKPFFPHFNRMNANTHRILGGFGYFGWNGENNAVTSSEWRAEKNWNWFVLMMIGQKCDYSVEVRITLAGILQYKVKLYSSIDQKVTGLNFN